MSNTDQKSTTQNAINNFSLIFKRLFGNVDKLEQNFPNYKEWEKNHKEKQKENKR